MTAYPAFAAGQKITAPLLQAMQTQWVIKPGNTGRPSNIVLADDPDLTFPVVANAVYDVELRLLFAGLNAAAIKVAWNTPSGTGGFRELLGPGTSASDAGGDNIAVKMPAASLTAAVVYSPTRNSASLVMTAIERALITVGATAGALTIQWAQNASASTGTVVWAGSRLAITRIS